MPRPTSPAATKDARRRAFRPACPRRLRPARRELVAALLLLLAADACGGPPGPDPPRSPLEAVEPPPDLAQLDRAVRAQLERLETRLEGTRTGRRDDREEGAAWGALGEWYQVYDYAESARRCYGNAERLAPREPRWPYFLGRLAEEAGRLEEAEAEYRRAAELAPEVAAPAVRLGDLALGRGELDRAEALYRKVLDADSAAPGALLGSARVALARGRPEAAVEALESLARDQPEAVQVNYTLSLAWRGLGDDRRADEVLRRIPKDNLDQVPLDDGAAWDRELERLDVGARTLTRRGVRAFRRGELERAAVLLGRAVAADPEGAEERVNYALALRRIGRWQAAREELEAALDRAKDGGASAVRAHLEMGRLLADLGRPAAAEPHFEAALEIEPDSVPAHLALGRLEQRQGDLEAALRQYGAVRQGKGDVAGVRFWHAALLLALGRRQEASAALAEDVRQAPDRRGPRLLLARLLSTAPEPELRDLPRARRLLAASGPPDVLFAETAAMVAASESRFGDAEAWQKAAVERLEGLPARSAVHTARRRLALYREKESCRTAWEAGERLVTAAVDAPGSLPRAGGPGGREAAAPPPAVAVPVAPAAFVRPAGDREPDRTASATGAGVARPVFIDVAAASGLRFEHDNGRSGQLYFVEPVGSGGALVDLDGDGDLDVVLVQGGPLVSPGSRAGVRRPASGGTRVFRNDLSVAADGERTLRFTDVTEESGLVTSGYGMGVAAGDFDDDGRIDLYLTGFGPNRLWRNVSAEGRLRFEDVTAEAGVDDPRWSTSASFADLDGDGRLDLFVANYVDFRLENHRPCRAPGGRLDYCGPQSYRGETDRLFLNGGDGTFRDVSSEAGILAPANGLGVVADDFDGDGRMDLYVANDLERNFLWHNLGNAGGVPRFENVALEAGCAVSMLGRAQASMGVVAGDFDGDGDDDLFMTHLSADTNTLYVNQGQGLFVDRSAASGLGGPSLAGTGFGTALFDYDGDGRLDVFVANGAVKVIEAEALAGDPFPLKQRNQLFANRGGTFVEVSAEAGPELARLEVSRGVAVGDVDNDGRSDLLLVNNDGPARLLLNRTPVRHPWLGLRVLTRTGRDALGARVEIVRRGGSPLWRRVATDGSYLSAGDPRVLSGLGDAPGVSQVRVFWPDGTVEAWSGLATDRYHTLVEGTGAASAPPALRSAAAISRRKSP